MVYRVATRSAQEPSPDVKAASLIDALPGNSFISKTMYVTMGAGLTAFTVSKELYVANDETVILAGFLIFATIVARTASKPYVDWADATIAKISDILNSARTTHTKSIQDRIDGVSKKQDIVDETKGLYAVSKHTVEAENEAYQLKQRTELAAEVKGVLDSWARFEQQQRESQQRDLADAIIKKVTGVLREDKTQKQIIDDSVAEIEKLVKEKKI
ncbi:atp4 subunit B of the stator stalk of mitochondrial F1F0 ATP synthase [Malassezia sp. CBS 17886]|nr:atp4 subunit B of the stator stalk of mitochondrial F1F0 ATP synthase [Malassezia sp. CBS 17886]